MGSMSGRGIGVQTNERGSPSEFNSLLEALTPGSQVIQSPPGYRGIWYRRPDGAIFGVRRSDDHGITVDVIQNNNPHIPNGYKVHQQ